MRKASLATKLVSFILALVMAFSVFPVNMAIALTEEVPAEQEWHEDVVEHTDVDTEDDTDIEESPYDADAETDETESNEYSDDYYYEDTGNEYLDNDYEDTDNEYQDSDYEDTDNEYQDNDYEDTDNEYQDNDYEDTDNEYQDNDYEDTDNEYQDNDYEDIDSEYSDIDNEYLGDDCEGEDDCECEIVYGLGFDLLDLRMGLTNFRDLFIVTYNWAPISQGFTVVDRTATANFHSVTQNIAPLTLPDISFSLTPLSGAGVYAPGTFEIRFPRQVFIDLDGNRFGEVDLTLLTYPNPLVAPPWWQQTVGDEIIIRNAATFSSVGGGPGFGISFLTNNIGPLPANFNGSVPVSFYFYNNGVSEYLHTEYLFFEINKYTNLQPEQLGFNVNHISTHRFDSSVRWDNAWGTEPGNSVDDRYVFYVVYALRPVITEMGLRIQNIEFSTATTHMGDIVSWGRREALSGPIVFQQGTPISSYTHGDASPDRYIVVRYTRNNMAQTNVPFGNFQLGGGASAVAVFSIAGSTPTRFITRSVPTVSFTTPDTLIRPIYTQLTFEKTVTSGAIVDLDLPNQSVTYRFLVSSGTSPLPLTGTNGIQINNATNLFNSNVFNLAGASFAVGGTNAGGTANVTHTLIGGQLTIVVPSLDGYVWVDVTLPVLATAPTGQHTTTASAIVVPSPNATTNTTVTRNGSATITITQSPPIIPDYDELSLDKVITNPSAWTPEDGATINLGAAVDYRLRVSSNRSTAPLSNVVITNQIDIANFYNLTPSDILISGDSASNATVTVNASGFITVTFSQLFGTADINFTLQTRDNAVGGESDSTAVVVAGPVPTRIERRAELYIVIPDYTEFWFNFERTSDHGIVLPRDIVSYQASFGIGDSPLPLRDIVIEIPVNLSLFYLPTEANVGGSGGTGREVEILADGTVRVTFTQITGRTTVELDLMVRSDATVGGGPTRALTATGAAGEAIRLGVVNRSSTAYPINVTRLELRKTADPMAVQVDPSSADIVVRFSVTADNTTPQSRLVQIWDFMNPDYFESPAFDITWTPVWLEGGVGINTYNIPGYLTGLVPGDNVFTFTLPPWANVTINYSINVNRAVADSYDPFATITNFAALYHNEVRQDTDYVEIVAFYWECDCGDCEWPLPPGGPWRPGGPGGSWGGGGGGRPGEVDPNMNALTVRAPAERDDDNNPIPLNLLPVRLQRGNVDHYVTHSSIIRALGFVNNRPTPNMAPFTAQLIYDVLLFEGVRLGSEDYRIMNIRDIRVSGERMQVLPVYPYTIFSPIPVADIHPDAPILPNAMPPVRIYTRQSDTHSWVYFGSFLRTGEAVMDNEEATAGVGRFRAATGPYAGRWVAHNHNSSLTMPPNTTQVMFEITTNAYILNMEFISEVRILENSPLLSGPSGMLMQHLTGELEHVGTLVTRRANEASPGTGELVGESVPRNRIPATAFTPVINARYESMYGFLNLYGDANAYPPVWVTVARDIGDRRTYAELPPQWRYRGNRFEIEVERGGDIQAGPVTLNENTEIFSNVHTANVRAWTHSFGQYVNNSETYVYRDLNETVRVELIAISDFFLNEQQLTPADYLIESVTFGHFSARNIWIDPVTLVPRFHAANAELYPPVRPGDPDPRPPVHIPVSFYAWVENAWVHVATRERTGGNWVWRLADNTTQTSNTIMMPVGTMQVRAVVVADVYDMELEFTTNKRLRPSAPITLEFNTSTHADVAIASTLVVRNEGNAIINGANSAQRPDELHANLRAVASVIEARIHSAFGTHLTYDGVGRTAVGPGPFSYIGDFVNAEIFSIQPTAPVISAAILSIINGNVPTTFIEHFHRGFARMWSLSNFNTRQFTVEVITDITTLGGTRLASGDYEIAHVNDIRISAEYLHRNPDTGIGQTLNVPVQHLPLVRVYARASDTSAWVYVATVERLGAVTGTGNGGLGSTLPHASRHVRITREDGTVTNNISGAPEQAISANATIILPAGTTQVRFTADSALRDPAPGMPAFASEIMIDFRTHTRLLPSQNVYNIARTIQNAYMHQSNTVLIRNHENALVSNMVDAAGNLVPMRPEGIVGAIPELTNIINAHHQSRYNVYMPASVTQNILPTPGGSPVQDNFINTINNTSTVSGTVTNINGIPIMGRDNTAAVFNTHFAHAQAWRHTTGLTHALNSNPFSMDLIADSVLINGIRLDEGDYFIESIRDIRFSAQSMAFTTGNGSTMPGATAFTAAQMLNIPVRIYARPTDSAAWEFVGTFTRNTASAAPQTAALAIAQRSGVFRDASDAIVFTAGTGAPTPATTIAMPAGTTQVMLRVEGISGAAIAGNMQIQFEAGVVLMPSDRVFDQLRDNPASIVTHANTLIVRNHNDTIVSGLTEPVSGTAAAISARHQAVFNGYMRSAQIDRTVTSRFHTSVFTAMAQRDNYRDDLNRAFTRELSFAAASRALENIQVSEASFRELATEQLNGVFYILLPHGMTADLNTLQVFHLDPTIGNATVLDATWETLPAGAAYAHSNHQDAVAATIISTEFIRNWRGTNTTMLRIEVAANGDNVALNAAGVPFSGFIGSIRMVYPFTAARDISEFPNVSMMYVSNSGELASLRYSQPIPVTGLQSNVYRHNHFAYRDNVTTSETTMPTGVTTSLMTYFLTRMDVAELPLLTGVTRGGTSGIGEPTDLYVTTSPITLLTSFVEPPHAFLAGSFMRVRNILQTTFPIELIYVQGQGGIPTSIRHYYSTVWAGDLYVYQIDVTVHGGTTVSDLVIFNRIEEINYDATNHFRGVIESIDLTHPIAIGAAPVVYFSTVPYINPHGDDAIYEAHRDLTNAYFWSTTMPTDRSLISAIAIDISTAYDGTPFLREEGRDILIEVWMRAPSNINQLSGRTAYNSSLSLGTIRRPLDSIQPLAPMFAVTHPSTLRGGYPSAPVAITATKTLYCYDCDDCDDCTDGLLPIQAGRYQFELEFLTGQAAHLLALDANGVEIDFNYPVIVTADGNGNIDFGTLTFHNSGTFTFLVSEIPSIVLDTTRPPHVNQNRGYTFDPNPVTVTVVVTRNYDTAILETALTTSKPGTVDTENEINFVNTFEYIPPVDLRVEVRFQNQLVVTAALHIIGGDTMPTNDNGYFVIEDATADMQFNITNPGFDIPTPTHTVTDADIARGYVIINLTDPIANLGIVVIQVPTGGWTGRPPRTPIQMAPIVGEVGSSVEVYYGSRECQEGGTGPGLWLHTFAGWFADRPTRGSFVPPLGQISLFTILDITGLPNTLGLQARFSPVPAPPGPPPPPPPSGRIEAAEFGINMATAAVTPLSLPLVSPRIAAPTHPVHNAWWWSPGQTIPVVNQFDRYQFVQTRDLLLAPHQHDNYRLELVQTGNWIRFDDGSEDGVTTNFHYVWWSASSGNHYDIPIIIDTSGLAYGVHYAQIRGYVYTPANGSRSPFARHFVDIRIEVYEVAVTFSDTFVSYSDPFADPLTAFDDVTILVMNNEVPDVALVPTWTRAGYTLVWSAALHPITAPVTFYAEWVENDPVTATFVIDDEVVYELVILQGQTPTPPEHLLNYEWSPEIGPIEVDTVFSFTNPRDGDVIAVFVDTYRNIRAFDTINAGAIPTVPNWSNARPGYTLSWNPVIGVINYNTVFTTVWTPVEGEAGVTAEGTTAVVATAARTRFIIGFEDGTFRPEQTITRAEASMMIFRLIDGESGNGSMTETFSDVQSDAWYAQAVNYLASLGLFRDIADEEFNPNEAITRVELAVILTRLLELNGVIGNPFTDITDHWAEAYILSAFENGLILGFEDETFRPDETVTRAQAVAMLNRAFDRVPDPSEINEILNGRVLFSDVTDEHWAFYYIMEASIEN